jgi:hypothetical protein
LKARDKERKLLEKKDGQAEEIKEPLLDKENEENELMNLSDEEKERRQFIKEEENPLNWKSINFLLFMELLVFIDQFVEGSNKVPSFVGI